MMPRLSAGALGKKRVTGSVTRSFPSISSFRMAAAVNCLEMEPMSDAVAAV